jgi:adenosylmethionine-8-amino-7-oxononanoate aminotransferase
MIANRSAVFYRDLNGVPPTIMRGEGVFLFDGEGRRYLDGSASASVVGIGHGRREIWEALATAGDAVTFVYGATFTHPWQERLAAAILAMAPKDMAAVYFTSGGSEANESAWKLARQYFVETGRPQKYKAIARWQGYHGVTLAALSLSGRTDWRRIYAPMLLPVSHIAAPYAYRCPRCAGQGCVSACADELERAILNEGPETVAMFIAEPVIGTSSPGVAPPNEYYARTRICDRTTCRSSQTRPCGYGRCARGSPLKLGVSADITTLGSGHRQRPRAPLLPWSCRTGARALRRSGRLVHGHLPGTPSSCFIGLKVHEIMQREQLFTRALSIGGTLKAGLDRLALRHQMIGEVRGRGLLLGIELVADRAGRTAFDRSLGVAGRVIEGMRRRGVIVAKSMAPEGDQVQISPPFTISETEVELLVAALDDTLSEVARSVQDRTRA